MFTPRLDILPDPQRRLWPELAAMPPPFVLYGGTALALRLGHRRSVDFDFFAFEPFDEEALLDATPLRTGTVLRRARQTITVRVDRGGPVLVSLFGDLHLARLEEADLAGDSTIRVAGLLDLAGTKAAVVTQRAEAKDYADIVALLRAGMALPDMLSAAQAIYGEQFNPVVAMKALAYHRDLGREIFPEEDRALLNEAIRRLDVTRLRAIAPLHPRRT